MSNQTVTTQNNMVQNNVAQSDTTQTYATQMDAAKRGIVTPQLEAVAKKENMSVE